MKDLARWTVVFQTLGNVNRLRITRMLYPNDKMNVGYIAAKLKISFTSTSNHLAILRRAGVLKSRGTAGQVVYSLNSKMPEDFFKAIKLLR